MSDSNMAKRKVIPSAPAVLGAPFLRRIMSMEDRCDVTRYPFNIAAFDGGID